MQMLYETQSLLKKYDSFRNTSIVEEIDIASIPLMHDAANDDGPIDDAPIETA